MHRLFENELAERVVVLDIKWMARWGRIQDKDLHMPTVVRLNKQL